MSDDVERPASRTPGAWETEHVDDPRDVAGSFDLLDEERSGLDPVVDLDGRPDWRSTALQWWAMAVAAVLERDKWRERYLDLEGEFHDLDRRYRSGR